MKIYIASHDQRAARRLAGVLTRAGHQITSRWLHKKFLPTDSFDLPTRWGLANENYDDVRRSDVLVLIAGPDRYFGGKFMEAGFAHGLGKHVLILGRRENMQCYGNHMKQVITRRELCAALSSPNVKDEPRGGQG